MNRDTYFKLERLGRIRLSEHFFMRQFLYSEIAAAFNIPNMPDDPDLAIETGTKLCNVILEPLMKEFGSLVIRSGFRSAKLNQFGAENNLACAPNAKNHAYHIWDHRDINGYSGAAACIVIPSLLTEPKNKEAWHKVALWVNDNLDYHRMTFFNRDFAFNIGWHEAPLHNIYSYYPYPHWIATDRQLCRSWRKRYGPSLF